MRFVELGDDQSDEVCEIVAKIDKDCSEELQNIFDEADAHSTKARGSLRSSWECDKANSKDRRDNFFQDQLNNGKLSNTLNALMMSYFLLENGSMGNR